MTSDSKNAAPKKAAKTSKAKGEAKSKPKASAAPKTAPTAPEKPAKKASKKKAVAVDGVERARLRRLARAGHKAERCALLSIPLDVGPRANPWHCPRRIDDVVVSELAVAIIESGVTPKALELAAARLTADREKS